MTVARRDLTGFHLSGRIYSMPGILLFYFFLQIFPITVSFSQDVNYTVYGRRHGLQSNYINDIARDDAGFFWLATDRGVVRFDGANFLSVSTFRNKNAIIKRLSIIGELAYLTYYDQNGVDTLNIRTLASGHLLDGPVTDVARIDSENIAVYKASGELIRLKNGKVRQVVKTDAAYDGLLKMWNGILFLQLAGKKLICLDPNSFNTIKEIRSPELEFTRGGFQSDSSALTIFMIGKVLTLNRNLELKRNQALNEKFGTSHNLVSHSKNLQYFIREGKELVTFDRGKFSDFIFPERSISELRTLFLIDSANLLIGTNGGLIHFRNTPEMIMKLNEEEALLNRQVRVRRNIIPVSPELTILSGYPGLIKWSAGRLSVVEPFRGFYVSDAVRLGDYIYAVGESRSLISWNFKSGKLKIFDFTNLLKEADQLTCIAVDPEKNSLMIAGRGGLFSFDPVVKKINKVAPMDGRSASKIVKTQTGDWLLCTDNGLLHFDGAFNLKHTYNSETPGIHLASDTINAVSEAGGTKFWVGHQKGVQLLDIDRGEVADSIPAAWFSDSRVAGILVDTLGRVWVSSFDGIVAYDPATRVHIRLSENSGMVNREFNKRSLAAFPNGRFMFGGVSGFDLINPYEFRFSDSKNLGVISSVIWFDEDGVVQKTILEDQSRVYRFDTEKESIRFLLAVRNFPETTSEKFQFRFGATGSWKDMPDRSYLDIYKLSPGSYTIEFRGIDRYGNVISFDPVQLDAEIVFYKSVTFIVTVFSAFVLSLILILLIIRRNQRHEFKIKESIAMDLHDEVGTTLTRALMVSRLTGEQRSDQKVQDYLSDALFSLRTYIRTMNRNFIPADQFFGDLQDTIHAALEHTGIRYHLSRDISGRIDFSSAMCRDIKLVFFELLNNVLKHSAATEVYINLKAGERGCSIDFYDNGIFSQTEDLKKSGFGINNIQKRVARYGGKAVWQVSPGGKGLRVELNFQNS